MFSRYESGVPTTRPKPVELRTLAETTTFLKNGERRSYVRHVVAPLDERTTPLRRGRRERGIRPAADRF